MAIRCEHEVDATAKYMCTNPSSKLYMLHYNTRSSLSNFATIITIR